MGEILCKFCGKMSGYSITGKPKIFCSNTCKSDWQRTQKPVDKDWLMQRYIVEELSIYKIAEIVNRIARMSIGLKG